MNNYQKKIIRAQEDFLDKESERYFKQKERLENWSWIKKKLLGSVYEDLIRDMEDLHKYNQSNITKVAQTLMGLTFKDQ